jgi:tubby-related protein 1
MTQPESYQVVHPQLSTETFEMPSNHDVAEEDEEEEEQNGIAIAPTNIDLSTQTVRVTRPVQPTDFILPRPLTTEKELLDLAFR